MGSASSKRPTWAVRPLKLTKRTLPRPERGGGRGSFVSTLGRVRGAALCRRSVFVGQSPMSLFKLEPISLKNSDTLNEKWVQDQVADDPSLLGLGDLILKDKERIQAGAGRLDLLLQDPETLKRYEVELQLGATDESH